MTKPGSRRCWPSAATASSTGRRSTMCVAYVQSLGGSSAAAVAAPESIARGREVFATNCVACHGEDAKGKRDLGAPDLTDASWIYGGDRQSIHTTVYAGHQGHMPHLGTAPFDDPPQDPDPLCAVAFGEDAVTVAAEETGRRLAPRTSGAAGPWRSRWSPAGFGRVRSPQTRISSTSQSCRSRNACRTARSRVRHSGRPLPSRQIGLLKASRGNGELTGRNIAMGNVDLASVERPDARGGAQSPSSRQRRLRLVARRLG